MSEVMFVGPSGEAVLEEDEPKLCERCPYNPVHALIRNGGEDVCPDAFKPVAIHCNYNYNCQIRDDDR